MAKHRKPTGELGSLEIGSGSATYRVERLPSAKEEIEKWALDSALSIARSRGGDVYSLVAPPTQNPENDFDFTLLTTRGEEDLDLMEVVLMSGNGYDAVATSYNVSEMATTTVERIRGKSLKYGRPTRPVHLLLYSTDWRFELHPSVIAVVASELCRQEHVFATVAYVYPGGGPLEQVFPNASVREEAFVRDAARSFVVRGELRKADIQPDGTVLIPVALSGGVYSQMYVRVPTAPTNTLTIDFHKASGTAGNQTLAVLPSLSGEVTDETNTDSVAAASVSNPAFVSGSDTQAVITAVGIIEWRWDDTRLLHVVARGLTDSGVEAAQGWCDATIGIGRVVLE